MLKVKRTIAQALLSEYIRVAEWSDSDAGRMDGQTAIRCIATRLSVYEEFTTLLEEHMGKPDWNGEDAGAILASAINFAAHHWDHDHFTGVSTFDAPEMDRVFRLSKHYIDMGFIPLADDPDTN